MLELPESHVIARQANEALRGKTIDSVETGRVPHRFAFYQPDETILKNALRGETIKGACAHGGLVEFDTERYLLYFSDGASPRYHQAGQLPEKHQLLIRFTDGDGIAVSIRMYGCMGVYPHGGCTGEYYNAAIGAPSPYEAGFTRAYFRSLVPVTGKRLSLKAFLATEQRIPGLGNGVLQDVLWNAALDPRLDVSRFDDEAFDALYDSAKSTLLHMRDAGGRSSERDLFGNAGGYRPILSKDTLGLPCPRCGEPIRKTAYMGGAVYFCEGCQKHD